MADEPGVSDQYRMSSPWPVFVALGLAIAEVGIVIGMFAVAVGGLVLLAGSVAGILTESGYVERLWNPLVGFGVALVAIGGVLFVTQLGTDFGVIGDVVARPGDFGRVVPRALAISIAGVLLLLAGTTGHLLDSDDTGY